MKQVWILNHYAQDLEDSGGSRHFSIAKYSKSLGWNCTLIAASFDHLKKKQKISGLKIIDLQTIDGVDFAWIKTNMYKGNSIARMVNMFMYTLLAILPWTLCKLPKPDIVVGSSVHPFAALAGVCLATRYKVPFVFEVRDLWPRTLIDMGSIHERSCIAYWMNKLEFFLYRKASKIIVLLPNAVNYISSLGIPTSKIHWIPNGVDLSFYHNSNNAKIINSDGRFTLMYIGSHGKANGLECLLQAAKIIQDTRNDIKINYRLIGDGPEKSRLIKYTRELGLYNVLFEEKISKSKVPSVSAEADAFVVTIRDLPKLYQYGISLNKLYDYMAAARPIIISSNAINNPIKEAKAGLTVRAECPEDLAQAILEMYDTEPSVRHIIGNSGYQYVKKNHDYTLLASNFVGILNDLSRDD